MTEAPARPDPKPFARFPRGPALLCAACLGMAAWTWLRYSHSWDLTEDLTRDAVRGAWPDRAYGHARLFVGPDNLPESLMLDDPHVMYSRPGLRWSAVPATKEVDASGLSVTCASGRVYVWDISSPSYIGEIVGFEFDSRASRFHPASFAGLVVGAMGCCVFGLYLRRWLKDSKADPTAEDA